MHKQRLNRSGHTAGGDCLVLLHSVGAFASNKTFLFASLLLPCFSEF